MRTLKTEMCRPDMSSGRFFCLLAGPLTLPSPRWGEGEGTA
jgi:hypothetical protein